MRKLVLLVVVALMATVWINQAIAAPKSNLKGTWEYKVPQAPYEYTSGKIIFAEADGKQTVVIMFNDGTEVKGKDVKFENDTFSFSTEVQYNLVKVTGKLVQGKLTGKVDSPDGLLELTATKKP